MIFPKNKLQMKIGLFYTARGNTFIFLFSFLYYESMKRMILHNHYIIFPIIQLDMYSILDNQSILGPALQVYFELYSLLNKTDATDWGRIFYQNMF